METTGRWNSEPAVERITFGLKMSTQSSTSTTPAQPAASAERITVPALPGSRTCQNAATIVRSSESPSMTAESRKARMSATASTPCASELMCCMTACVTLCT